MGNYPGRIPEDFIQTLLSRIDIVEVIGEHVSLRKTGANYMACCPFHNEKTPSFSVNQSKQFYHCFGCGVSGDAIQFLKEKTGVSFVEAVELLATQAGLSMPVIEEDPKFAQQNLIYNVLSEASSFYAQQLREHPVAKHAVQYLKDRGLTGIVAKRFQLGFAPPGWDNLLNSFPADKQARDTGVMAGLLINRDDRYYDRFRNRVMFPIRNRRGNVIGFGGRVIDKNSDEPKYLNSPETPAFNKSYELYGLYEARQAISQADRVIVVEGYMDVVSLAQAGLQNVVATLGTACTSQHVKLLFKHATEVVFCFDGDKAGRKAAWRALELCLPLLDDKHRIKFLLLPSGLDPDSYVRERGLPALEEEIAQSISLPDYLFNTITKQADLDQIDGRVHVANSIKHHLEKIPEGLLKTMLFDRLAGLIKVEPSKLHKQKAHTQSKWGQFSQTVLDNNQRGMQELVLVSPAMRAVALLFAHRELLIDLPSLTGIESVDIAGCKLLCAVGQILQSEPQIEDDQVKAKLSVQLSKYFIPAQLRGIARLVPEGGLKQEFQDALGFLRKRKDELELEKLLAKAKQNQLSAEDKSRMQQLLQDLGPNRVD